MNRILLLLPLFLVLACTVRDATTIIDVARSKDPIAAIKSIGTRKAVSYALDPAQFQKDAVAFASVLKKFNVNIDINWGKENVRKPTQKKYVKYTQNYESRAEVDFTAGIITVETLNRDKSVASLKEAIVTTLLTPDDPRGVDLFSSEPVKLTGTPYLKGEVLDNNGREIASPSQAEKFANYLVTNQLQEKSISVEGKQKQVHYVTIPMVKDHNHVRANKYKEEVREFANRFQISRNLMFAIMKTESNFNPYAVSSAPAYGLMQIVPQTAGRDAYRKIHNKDRVPTKDYLFRADLNIEMGAAYLNILKYTYLGEVTDPLSREYCMIAAYNTGSGNVLGIFSKDQAKAVRMINSMKPGDLYRKLTKDLRHEEARRYLSKVVTARKEFVGI